jgi:hypothetical protein
MAGPTRGVPRPLPLLAATVLLVPAIAFAQNTSSSATAPTGTPAATATGAATGTATSSGPPAPKNEWGATWNTKPSGPVVIHRVWRTNGPTAVLPGFEPLDSGGSRFFVQLTQTVPVTEQRATGTITYILKGAHVNVYNNERPLMTVHFNTPVWRARLVPYGNDLHFVLELRSNVAPTWQMTPPSKDGMTFLQIDFPSGVFLPSDSPAAAFGPAATVTPTSTATVPAPTSTVGPATVPSPTPTTH